MNGASKTIQSAFDHHELVERMMGNATIAQRMLGKFLCNGPVDVDLMESTVRMGSSADIAALAHRHKGTAKTRAAPRMPGTPRRPGASSKIIGVTASGSSRLRDGATSSRR